MPCDTARDHDNLTTFNDMLQEISDTSASLDAQHIVIGGDLNTDFRRLTSLHTRASGTYLIREDIKYGLQLILSEVDYTYQSKINNERSIIDHFLLTDNLYNMISEYKVVHDGDNLSDHSVLQMVLQLPVEYINESGVANRQCDRRIQWRTAQLAHLQQYRYTLDYLLDDVHVPAQTGVGCGQPCEDTISSIESLHDSIVNACLEAGNVAIPRRNKRQRASPLFGWMNMWASRGNGPYFGI